MGNFIKEFFKEGFWAALFELLKAGYPVLLALAVMIGGYLDSIHLPWPYLIVLGGVVFATFSHGALQFSQWQAGRTSSHKLNFGGAGVAFDYVRDATGRVTGISYAQGVVTLPSLAAFPLSVIIDDVSVSVDSRVNPNPVPIKAQLLDPQSFLFLRPTRIDMGNMPPKDRIEARIKFKCRYGRAGKERFELTRDVTVTCVFDENTGYANQVLGDATV
jgi:hypothetical protein